MSKVWEASERKSWDITLSFTYSSHCWRMSVCLEKNTDTTHRVITSLCKIMDLTWNEMGLFPLNAGSTENWSLFIHFEDMNRKQSKYFLVLTKNFFIVKIFLCLAVHIHPHQRRWKCFIVTLTLKHITVSSTLSWVLFKCLVAHFWNGLTFHFSEISALGNER